MSNSACYDFDANYFDLPFTNELKPVSKAAQEEIHVIVFVRECSRGYMVFSESHKHFLFSRSKASMQMIAALDLYVKDRDSSPVLYYTLTAAGIPKYGSVECTDGRYWVQDITGFSFMEASWNGASISEASNPFLVQGARGEAATSVPAHEETPATSESSDKRKTRRG
jgi:hypothetical protein